MWPQARICASGLAEEPTCRACGEEAGTTRHRLWRCPATAMQRHQETGDPVVEAAAPLAAASGAEDPFWSFALLAVPREGGHLPVGGQPEELHW
eukprot:11195076-Lingulodinium_polyedra.AAC.1